MNLTQAGDLTIGSVSGTGTGNLYSGLLIAKGPGGNYNENIRLPGSTAVISFNTTGLTGAGSYNIVSQTNFQIRNAGGSQVFVMDQAGNLTMSGDISGGYILGSYFNASAGNSSNPTIGQIWTQDTNDNYLRKSTPAHFRSQITDGYYVTGSGTAGYIPKFTGTGFSIGNSGMYDDGTTVSLISRALSVSSTVTATGYNRASAGTGFLNGKYGGVETTATTGPIYCIGDSYVPTSTTTNTMYGIGYSYNSFTGAYGPANTWGMYVVGGGTVGIFLAADGRGYFSSTITASSFSGAGTGLTGTASSLSIGGNAATATAAAGVSFLTQPNANWAGRIQLGGNGGGGTALIAVVQSTNGNLHMDAGSGNVMYLNYYNNGTIWLNGATYNISSNGSQYNGNAASATLAANTSSISSAVGGSYNWTGINYFVSNRNTTSDSPPLQAYSSNGSGAIMSFHRGGYYAVNMGLDSDNVFRIGGWSASPNRLQLDMSGNMTVAGHVRAGTNVYTDANYGYGLIGLYSSTRFQGVFSMGAAYLLAADGTTPGNLYGLAWSYPSAGGQAANLSSHGLLVMQNGVTMAAISTNIWISGIYYGSGAGLGGTASGLTAGSSNALEGYAASSYLNKNGVSYYQASTWIQLNGAHGLYAPSYNGAHWLPNTSSTYTTWRIAGSRNGYSGIHDDHSAVQMSMFDGSGNGGTYREANGKWYWYYVVANDCFAVGGSTTSASYRLYVNGPAYASGIMYADGGFNSGSADIQWGGSERQVGRYRYLWYGYWAQWYDLNGGNGGGSLVYADTLYATYGSVSDIRYKKEVTASTYGLSDVLKMNTIKYKYDLPLEKRSGDDPNFHIGFSAQEMLEIVPEAVMYDKTREVYAIATNEIIPVLVNSIKELKAEINELKNNYSIK